MKADLIYCYTWKAMKPYLGKKQDTWKRMPRKVGSKRGRHHNKMSHPFPTMILTVHQNLMTSIEKFTPCRGYICRNNTTIIKKLLKYFVYLFAKFFPSLPNNLANKKFINPSRVQTHVHIPHQFNKLFQSLIYWKSKILCSLTRMQEFLKTEAYSWFMTSHIPLQETKIYS